MTKPQQYLAAAEDVADQVIRSGRKVIPKVGKICLIASFLEDGIRMLSQWDEQREYVDETWLCGKFLGTMFVLINMLGQLVGCWMVISRRKPNIAVGLLLSIVLLQIVTYSILWNLKILSLKLGLIGALILVLAEGQVEEQRLSLFAGLPSLGENRPKVYMQLIGRILLALMFLGLIRFQLRTWPMIQDIFAIMLMIFVVLGYKTKLSALILVALLFVLNLYHNAWWNIPDYRPLRDFLKYSFFQTLTVIGGLLMIVSLGPGSVSIDARKKMW
ncbi:surfeit locus protein 4 homolog [Drosophila serrata]|uniref:surfeit locus protein 4 homolog n=1 Tax=Drosophila serrata TaxID=7274 RepID=UPI000A1D0023|nr:surfeit locus protein 4 homolog [Drosophila serrata]